jgi:hypothetical protein
LKKRYIYNFSPRLKLNVILGKSSTAAFQIMIIIHINGCWNKYFEALVHGVTIRFSGDIEGQQEAEGFD